MPLLPTSNPPPTPSSSTHTTTSSIPDDFPQNPTSEARGKDAIDAKNKKGNGEKKEKTADEIENERLYEERIEEEYAKREGGAWKGEREREIEWGCGGGRDKRIWEREGGRARAITGHSKLEDKGKEGGVSEGGLFVICWRWRNCQE